jgi:hypothetical protein
MLVLVLPRGYRQNGHFRFRKRYDISFFLGSVNNSNGGLDKEGTGDEAVEDEAKPEAVQKAKKRYASKEVESKIHWCQLDVI